jgi:ATP-binding cassette subfamily B protein
MAWGAHLVSIGAMGAGSLAAAVLYLVRAQYPLVGLGIMAAVIQRGRASLDRVIELEAKLEIIPTFIASAPPQFDSLSVQNLSFSYPDQNDFVLKRISLDLQIGRMIGIVGPTGSGKSTLAKILAGIIPPPPHACFLNGQDLAYLHEKDNHGTWRQTIAYAPQDGFLFSWTISENIALSSASSSDDSIMEVSSQAGLTPDIPQFPNGLDSILGEKGVNLSGGQRQRVGLARAFLSQSPLLVLDDVLSAVDPRTEQRIVGTLQEFRLNHAILLVSHRYEALQNCNEIVYLEEGQIVERGTHTELVQLGGRYALNWKIQHGVPGVQNA